MVARLGMPGHQKEAGETDTLEVAVSDSMTLFLGKPKSGITSLQELQKLYAKNIIWHFQNVDII